MRQILLAIALAALAGCATPPTDDSDDTTTPAVATIPYQTFNDKEALALRVVITLRTAATQLMTAQKISVEQDVLIQKQLDLAVDGLKVARSMYSQKPAEASAQLTAALGTIDALRTQLGVK